jgi:hypothetical protein
MMRLRIVCMIMVPILSGCSDSSVERELAKCKMKAIELYKPQREVWRHGPSSAYVRECMVAAGYLPSSECGPDMSDFSGCYRPPSIWW